MMLSNGYLVNTVLIFHLQLFICVLEILDNNNEQFICYLMFHCVDNNILTCLGVYLYNQ